MNSLVFLLGTASEWVAQASDFITAKWPELLAILTSTTFVTWLLVFLGKIILAHIQARIKRKNDIPVLEKYKELENKFATLENNFQLMFAKFIEQINASLVQNKQAEIDAQKQFYDQVMNEETQKVVENTPQLEVPVEEIPSIVENDKGNGQICEETPVVEELVEEVKVEPKKAENKGKKQVVAKKVIEG